MQMLPVEECIEALIDYRGKTPRKTESGIRLVTAKVIKSGRITNKSFEYIAEEDYDLWMRRGLPIKGDVLVTTEAPLGEVAQIDSNERIALAQRVILLRANPKVMDQDYLLFAIQSDLVQGGLNARATGTTVAGIKQSELRKVLLPCPDLNCQKSVAGILKTYDNLIDNNNRRIAILEEMAQSLYHEWFVKFRFPGHQDCQFKDSPLGQIPEGWEVKSAAEVIDINPRTSLPREGLKPFVPMTSLSESSMIIGAIEERAGNSGTKFKNRDTLFARITPCLQNGKIGYVQFLNEVNPIGFGSTEFIVLRESILPSEYIYCLARSSNFRSHAINSMAGADGRQRVKPDCFSAYFLVIPKQGLLELFANMVKPCFKKIHNLNKKNENLKQQRNLLLPKLISGSITV